MLATFVESRIFTARWHVRQSDETLRELQLLLLAQPRRGDAIPGCGLLRKVRLGDPTRGKGRRGGLRVVYMYTPEAGRFDLLTVYDKGEADDLTPKELALLCELAKGLRSQLLSRITDKRARRKDRP